jgi:cyclopropane-fatty-acyl-phospholipid synthase
MITDFILEKNLAPDLLIRASIRKRLRNTLKKQSQPGFKEADAAMDKLVMELKQSPIAVSVAEANEQHYEVPAMFYQIVLGPFLKYSCGLWENELDTLESSEIKMLELTAERADIKNGNKILDLGCGWGSFSLFAAAKFPEKEFVAVSNSNSQREFIEKTANLRGIKNLKVITSDINDFDPGEKFDRVVSVEMFEHVRNYEKLFHNIHSWMEMGGRLFVHIFNHKQFAYKFEVKDSSDWMARHFFTGGMMPSDRLLLKFSEGFALNGHWNIIGTHYSKTLEAWLKNMDANKTEIMRLFRKTYNGHADKFWAYWRVFFMACSETFKIDNGAQWQVSHYVFLKE